LWEILVEPSAIVSTVGQARRFSMTSSTDDWMIYSAQLDAFDATPTQLPAAPLHGVGSDEA
jgi:hypothetical protein